MGQNCLSVTLCILLFTSVVISTVEEKYEGSPIVETKYGPVQGVKVDNHFEFRGVPFAKSPVGPLRFKIPEQPTPWSDVYQAITFPEYCLQYNSFWNSTEGVEDCLYLSVFTPHLPVDKEDDTPKLPVMFYIHPGGFMFGRGAQYGGEYLMEHKNVVLVVIQYRLGSLGFLNTGDEQSFGNMGMKDQVQALKFVQENIARFGGDKERVMIFGSSAGSASVHYHILSPLSKGLFHTAFSGSGSALNPWAFQPNPISHTIKLAKLNNCPTEDTAKLIACLRTKDAHDIVFSHSKFLDYYTDPIAAFGPSVEIGSTDDTTTFLSDTPINMINMGVINEVPWIIGFATDEGFEHTMGIMRDPVLLEHLNTKWKQVFPITFEYVNEPDKLQEKISERVRQFYFDKQPVTVDNLKNLSNAYSDKTFIHGVIEAALLHAKLNRVQTHPVYLFNFAYQGAHSMVTLKGHSRQGFVASHIDDIQYLLTSLLFPKITRDAAERPFQQKYLKMITSFVATGKIPPFEQDKADQTWKPLSADGKIKYYHITDNPKMEVICEELKKRVEFWREFPLREYHATKTHSKDEL